MVQGVIVAVGLSIVGYTIFWVAAHHYMMPVNDDIYDRLRLIRSGPTWSEFFKYLIAPHNEHRIATTRIIALADDAFFRGKENLQIYLCIILQLIIALIAAVNLARDIDGRSLCANYIFPFSIFAVLSVNPMFLYTFAIQFQIQHTLMATMIVGLSAWASGLFIARPSIGRFSVIVGVLFGLALLATFTLGNAPVLLMAFAFMAALARWPIKYIAVLSVLAFGHAGLILLTKSAAGPGSSFDLINIAKFVMIYLGSPFLRFGAWPATFVTWGTYEGLAYILGGVIFSVFSAAVLVRLFKPGFGGKALSFGLFILTCIFITALAGAYTRVGFGILEGANKKYASFAALGWLGAIAISVGVVQEMSRTRVNTALTIFYIFLAAVLFPMTIYSGQSEMRIWQKASDRSAESSIAVLLKINSAAHLHDLFPDPPAAADYFRDIEQRNLSVFSRYPVRWGADATKFLARYKQSSCKGEVERFDPIAPTDLSQVFDVPGTPFTMRGWAWMTDSRSPASFVIAVDASDRIVGFALSTRVSERAEEWLSQKFTSNAGWFGFARTTDSPVSRFYAIEKGKREYCLIDNVLFR